MFKSLFTFLLLLVFYGHANAQVLETVSIRSPKTNIFVKITQQDVNEYIISRNISDTAGKLQNYVSIIKNAKISTAFKPDLSYEKALISAEQGEKMRNTHNAEITPTEITEYLSIRKITGDTTGKTKDYRTIIKNAKFRMTFFNNPTYEEALIGAEEFIRRKNMVDKVLVIKSERKMHLQKNGKTVKTYSIGLGPHPVGQKEYEGDGKTPEGIYTLDWQKWNSSTLHSFHISYPNQQDIIRAKTKGLVVGSNIMVHGTSKGIKKKKDWTNGCIALTNNDMLEFRNIVFQDTPIEIRK